MNDAHIFYNATMKMNKHVFFCIIWIYDMSLGVDYKLHMVNGN